MVESNAQTPYLLAFVADKETEATISALATAHPQQQIEAHIGGIEETVQHLSKQRSPHILLIDLSESNLPLSDLQKLIGICEPGVQVIAIGTRNDVGIFRDILRLGVKDYLAKPLTPALLARSLEALGLDADDEQAKSVKGFMDYGQVIAFIGARGGVGASTCAANTAWILSEERQRFVSLVDLNLHTGTIARQFNLEPTSSLYQALESAEQLDETLIERAMVQYSKRLSILAGEESFGHKMDISAEAINRLMSILTQRFHYTVVDLPLCFDHILIETLIEYARTVVIVTDLTLFSLRDAVRLLALCNAQKAPTQRHIVIANRCNKYKNGAIDASTFEKSLGKSIDAFIPFDHSQILEAMNIGQPVASLDSVMANPLRKFVDLLVGESPPPSHNGLGILNRLLGKLKSQWARTNKL